MEKIIRDDLKKLFPEFKITSNLTLGSHPLIRFRMEGMIDIEFMTSVPIKKIKHGHKECFGSVPVVFHNVGVFKFSQYFLDDVCKMLNKLNKFFKTYQPTIEQK
jgi:hypothetical protein